MVNPTEMAERHCRILARMAEQGAVLADRFFEHAMATEDRAEAESLGRSHQRACRSVRQSIALEAKLVRDAARKDREDREDAAREQAEAVQKRKARARAAVKRLIWTEAEGAEAILLDLKVGDLLDEAELSETLGEGPIEALIARLCKDLGLSPNGTAEPAPEPIRKPARRKPPPKPAKPFSNLHDDPWKDWRSG